MKMMSRSGIRGLFLTSATSVLALGLAAQAAAQEVEEQEQPASARTSTEKVDGEIVVTATRRETSLLETPLSVSVLGGEALTRDGITTVEDLTGRIPSLLIGTQAGGATIAIRGIGFAPIRPGDEGRVAYYVDGVYIARPSAQLGTMFDVAQLEVLRGPQGTLYGRNATGGALLVTTRDPTSEPSGYLNVTAGNYDLLRTEGAIGGPISDTLSARIAFQTTDRDGYLNNIVTGNDVNGANTRSIRGTVLWEPTDNFSLRMAGDWHREDDDNYHLLAVAPGFTPPPANQEFVFGTRDIRQAFDGQNYRDSYGGSLKAQVDFSPEVSLSAMVSARHIFSYLFVAANGTPMQVARVFADDSDQYSADLQLTGDFDRFNFVAGVSYFNEDQTPSLRSATFGSTFRPADGPDFMTQGVQSFSNLRTNSWAFFGEGTFNITPELSVTGGLRYTAETKKSLNDTATASFYLPWPDPNADNSTFFGRFGWGDAPLRGGFPTSGSTSYHPLTIKAAVNWEFSPGFSAYATYVEGFKSGGFNYGTVQPPYSPEEIENYELGLRGNLAGGISFSVAAFRMKYSALQQTLLLQGANPGTFIINTGTATIDGIEAEFDVRIGDAFRINGNGALLDATFGPLMTTNTVTGAMVDIGGNRIPQAPRYTFSIGADYTMYVGDGQLVLRGDYRRNGRTYFDIFNNAPLQQKPYGVGDASLTYTTGDEQWRFSAWIKNIGNTYAGTAGFLQRANIGGHWDGGVIPPRTYGLTAGYSF